MSGQLGGGLSALPHHTSLAPRRHSTSSRAAAALLLSVVAVLLGRLAQVHEQTWDVRLWPSATPTKLVEDGRDYRRAGTVARVDRQFVLLDRTPAGADVLGPRSAYVPTVLTLRTPKGLTSYSLMGGP